MTSTIEISRSALLHNLQSFQSLYPKQEIIPVVKSNAYGCGIEAVAYTIKNHVLSLAVVSTDEALKLRKLLPSHRIIVLSIINEKHLLDCIRNNIELPLYNEYYADLIYLSASKLSTKAKVHLKLDTGTHRVGYSPKEFRKVFDKYADSPWIEIIGIFSHFAASEELPNYTKEQSETFSKTLKGLVANQPIIHMACSAAAIIGEIPKYSNAIRLGLSLYGYWPSDLAKDKKPQKLDLRPVLSWKSSIIHLQKLKTGDCIGYGCAYKVTSNSTIATVPVGYFDGYSRSLSNKSKVIIQNTKCPVRGRICMNLMMVDVSKIDYPRINDEVLLIGKQKSQEITVEELSDITGTINYEFISRLNSDIPRILVK